MEYGPRLEYPFGYPFEMLLSLLLKVLAYWTSILLDYENYCDIPYVWIVEAAAVVVGYSLKDLETIWLLYWNIFVPLEFSW